MSALLDNLKVAAQAALGERLLGVEEACGQLTLRVAPDSLLETLSTLRDHPLLKFEQCVDLCGVDYSHYADGGWEGPRFAVVYHLLSLSLNQRVRVRVFCSDEAQPQLPSALAVWPSVNWYEREAFDLYGIIFIDHPDLRRILTDYGFIGHPFRKDFPVTGNVEVRFDETQQRVLYQPVTIEPREITPRLIREEGYGR